MGFYPATRMGGVESKEAATASSEASGYRRCQISACGRVLLDWRAEMSTLTELPMHLAMMAKPGRQSG